MYHLEIYLSIYLSIYLMYPFFLIPLDFARQATVNQGPTAAHHPSGQETPRVHSQDTHHMAKETNGRIDVLNPKSRAA